MAGSMLHQHFDSPLAALYNEAPQAARRLLFKMPRVVPDQKSRFDSDEIFRRLAREGEVRYTSCRDRPPAERQQKFKLGIVEGHVDVAILSNGTNINLSFSPNSGHKEVDFEKESGKVHLRSSFILNGVCVRWRGWMDLDRLDGVGCLEYDEENAVEENRLLQEEIEKYKQRLHELEAKQQRSFRVPQSNPHSHPHLNAVHSHAHLHGHSHPTPTTIEQNNIQVR